MSETQMSEMRARANDLFAQLRREHEEFRSVLSGVLARTGQRRRRAKVERRPPVNAIEARILRGEFGWGDVLQGKSDDAGVKAAQRYLGPRLRLLQQAAFNICDRDQPVEEAFAELDTQIAALTSPGRANSGKGESHG